MNLIKPFRIALVVLILLLGLPAAKAQQGGQGGGTGGTVSPPPKEGPKPPGVAPQQPTMPGESRKLQPVTAPVIFVTGRVVMDNGEPPPMGATIERDCGGLIKREATVDLAGNFGFQIGGDQRPGVMIPDASQGPMGDLFSVDESAWGSTSGPQGQGSSASFSRLLGCEFRAELSGYRSSTVRLDDLHVTGPVNAGTIVLFPIGRVRGTLVSATSMLAPKAAKKSLERARKAYRKKKFDEAETLLKRRPKTIPNMRTPGLCWGGSISSWAARRCPQCLRQGNWRMGCTSNRIYGYRRSPLLKKLAEAADFSRRHCADP
jgi:hypothetical protein